ncbi:sodium channel subunit beta-3 isoform X2 [Triplophysa rosa]|uniref:sodium channel subunit beta-3 isoform X2 n=1 Tax=Triplophysa rosa TaxID=992332 RepID=UPI002545C047|nr:sodium channel subunit beta-3 isoform X2 [Triplophysa rosa]
MATQVRVVLHLLLLYIFAVQEGRPVCVDVDPETEAVKGEFMKMKCVYCMKREEISTRTMVKWYYIGPDKREVLIYEYHDEPREPQNVEDYWKGRLVWNGSKDMQDISIGILNVTLNDTGTYKCKASRHYKYTFFTSTGTKNITINLKVKEKASQDTTALYSQIMMYVLLVFLTFWLLVEMIYCYRKISKSDEQAQDNATDYLAIPSENKENPEPAVTE